MAELRYPRFNTIYPNREEAIKKLSEITRSYGEPVVIRYYNKKVICVIVAIYKSDRIGDYEISYDSNADLLSSAYTIDINTIDKIALVNNSPENYIIEGEEMTDMDYINIALGGKIPVISDIVVIKEDLAVRSYIYTKEGWQPLSVSSSSGDFNLVLGDSMMFEENETGESVLEVKTDNSSIIYDDNVGGLTVRKIYGGTF